MRLAVREGCLPGQEGAEPPCSVQLKGILRSRKGSYAVCVSAINKDNGSSHTVVGAWGWGGGWEGVEEEVDGRRM